MDITSLNLIKTLNSIETKTSVKESNVDKINNFKEYLSKSKNELKESNVSDNSKNIKQYNVNKDSNEDLKEVVNKIESILENKDENLDNIDNEDFIENITEIIMMLLNHFSSLTNSTSEEIPSFNLETINEINIDNITMEDINKFVTENLTLKDEYIDKGKVILDINNINNTVNELLNNIDYDSFKEEEPLNETLIKQVNELIKDVFDREVFQSGDSKLNENLEIMELVNYLKSNFIKEDSKLENPINEVGNFGNLNNTDSIKVVEEYENQSNADFDTKENNNDIQDNKKDVEVSKEEDFLSKILNDDTTNTILNNPYDRLFNNRLPSNIETINGPVNINKGTMNTDIIKNIRYMINDSIQELSVKIYPQELGEVTIKILSEEGIMRAEIKATSKETYNLINSNIHDIKKSLENQNIKIQEVNIGIYNEDATFFSGKENQKENSRNFSEDLSVSYIYEDEEIIEEVNLNNNVNYLA